jgi:hypothetical protein
MQIDRSDKQLEKAEVPRHESFESDSNVTLERSIQALKAFGGICSTEDEMKSEGT